MGFFRETGLPSLLATAGFMATMVMVQLWAARLGWQWDASVGRRFTLAPYTKRVLAEAGKQVRLYAFAPSGLERSRALLELVDRFAQAAPGLSVQVFDTNRSPEVARRLGVDTNLAVVVESGQRRRLVTHPNEIAISAAIATVYRTKSPRLIWFGQDRGRDYGRIWAALQAEGFEPTKEPPAAGHPERLEIAVFAGAEGLRSDVLRRWCTDSAAGSRCLVLAESDTCRRSPDVCQWLRETWGVAPSGETIVDHGSRLVGGDPFTIAVPGLAEDHPISATMGKPPLFSGATPVERVAAMRGVEVWTLLYSAPSAQAVRETARPGGDEGHVLRRGSLPVALAAVRRGENGSEARLVVAGDRDFATDRLLEFLGNKDFFLNTLNWLSDEVQMLGERAEERPFGIQHVFFSAADIRNLFWTLSVLPAVGFSLVGFAVWWRRRNL